MAFNNEAVLSATPSIKEMVVLDAPSDKRNNGIILYTIFVEVSVKKLVIPVANMLRGNLMTSFFISTVS